VLEGAGAAIVLEERDLVPGELGRRVLALATDPVRLRSMATASEGHAHSRAADVIASRMLELCRTTALRSAR